MTNRDFLELVSTDGLPDASAVLEGAQKPRRVWRRVAVAVVAAAAIGAVVTVGAQVHMNELEKIEASTGKESITDITQLEPGKLYTIEDHVEFPEETKYSREQTANYRHQVYNELPEGTNPRELPMEPADSFSDDDEGRLGCVRCDCFAWTPTDPVEYSYQRPSASEPETFNMRALVCAECGYTGDLFTTDDKAIPYGLYLEIRKANHIEVETPEIEGLTLLEDSSELLEEGVVYRAYMYEGEVFFYESTPENNGKVKSWVVCPNLRDHVHSGDLIIGEVEEYTHIDRYYGDEYTITRKPVFCADCGEVVLMIVIDD